MGWKDDLVILEENLVVDGNNGGQDEPVACECMAKGKCCDDETCFNFSTQIECVDCANPKCRNQRLQRKEWAKLEVRETPLKHGYGLFAGEDFIEGQFILQFLGEVINKKTMQARSCNGAKQLYLQNIGPNVYFDATTKGSIARFTNHCCEPNVKHERWIVDGRLCIGVFALRDITKGEELGFDYHWKYNRQKPTRCHCGAETCRGFLEELDEDQKTYYAVRKGVWRNSAEAVQECENEQLQQGGGDQAKPLHQWLVDKRVRVFWEGNHKRWDANVEMWNEEKKVHELFYIVDAKTSPEQLLQPTDRTQCNPQVEWQWLDESQQEHTISKKSPAAKEGSTTIPAGGDTNSMDDMFGGDSDDEEVVFAADGGQVAAAASAKDSGRVWTDKPPERPPQKQKLRATVEVTFLTAQYMVLSTLKNAAASASAPSSFKAEDAHDQEAVYTRFFEMLRQHCPAVRCQRLPSSSASKAARTAGGAAGGSMRVLVFGDEDHVKTVQDLLDKNAAQQQGIEADRRSTLQQELSGRQGMSLSYDWRVLASLVEVNARSSAHPADKLLQVECALLGSVHAALKADSNVFNQPLMCPLDKVPDCQRANPATATPVAASGGGTDNAAFNSQTLSEVSKKSMLESLRKLGNRLNCYSMTTLHATALLLRYFNYSGATDSIIRESTALIAACCMLAEKARGNFSPVHLKRFVTAAYCVVFNREESSVGDMTTVVQRTLASEEKLLSVLRSDVGIPDAISLVYKYWCVEENTTTNANVDDLWMFDKHCGGLKSCGALGVSLATTFPYFWQMWAPDVMTITTLMVDCIACELTEQKLYGSSGDQLKPQPIFCSMWKVASCSLRLTLSQILWLLTNTSTLAAQLSDDMQPKWFQGMQEEADKRNFSLSWSALVGNVGTLAETWLRQGDLLDFTFDATSQGNSGVEHLFGDSYGLRFPWLSADTDDSSAATNYNSQNANKTDMGASSFVSVGGITALSREMYTATLPANRAVAISAGHLGADKQPTAASLRPWPLERAARKETGQLKAARLADDDGNGNNLGCGVSASALHELCMLQQVHSYSALHLLSSGNSNDVALVSEKRVHPVCPYVMPVLGVATLPGSFGLPKFSRIAAVLSSSKNESMPKSPSKSDDETSSTDLRHDSERAGAEADFLRSITLGSGADSPRGARAGEGGMPAPVQCFLVAPVVRMGLETLLSYSSKKAASSGSGSEEQLLSPAFALELCRDVFSAVDHMTSAGVVLKWMDPANIFICPRGRVVLGGLQGVSHAGSGALACGLPTYITNLERDRERSEREKRKKRQDNKRRHKKRGRSDMDDDAEAAAAGKHKRHKSKSKSDKDKDSSGAATTSSSSSIDIGSLKVVKGPKVNKPSLPHLPSTAPEVVLGGLASARSSVYSAASLCVIILSGKFLFRGADNEQAHLQQVYKVLGTPSKESSMHLQYFKELPLESVYGSHVMTPDGPQSTRSRAFKALKAAMPAESLTLLSSPDSDIVRTEARGKDKLLDEDYSDSGRLLDVLRGCLYLTPVRRFEGAAQVLHQRLFTSRSPLSSADRTLELEKTLGAMKVVVQVAEKIH